MPTGAPSILFIRAPVDVTNMPTIKQKTAFDKIVKNMSEGNPKTAGEILTESGYGKIALQPSRILDSKGFQELLTIIDDKEILDKFRDILLGDDKRSSLSAGIELLKLKNRYPQQENKVIGLFEKVGELQTNDKSQDSPTENLLPSAQGSTGSPELQE